MIYQAVGYKRTMPIDGPTGPVLHPVRRGDRTSSWSVAAAQADWMAQEFPDLIWSVETVGASQQVRR